MPEILRFKETPYDGVLIACFSNHPLVHILRESLPQRQPVVGIMEAAVIHALQLGGKYAVISMFRWDRLVGEANKIEKQPLGNGSQCSWKASKVLA